MGQISLPVINRSGLSMHWESSGESNYNKSNFYVKDVYIRDLISLIYKSYVPFFSLSRINSKITPGIYLSDKDIEYSDSFDRALDNRFHVYTTNESYSTKAINYIGDYDDWGLLIKSRWWDLGDWELKLVIGI